MTWLGRLSGLSGGFEMVLKCFQLTHDIIYNIILNMVGWRNLFEKIRQNPKNVHFNDLCRLVEKFGFRFRGGKGSHKIYVRKGIFEILNFQNVGGMAKPYQIRQFLNVIDKYNLKMGE